MPLPFAANTTCDIYRSGNSPPAAPDVAAVACHLKACYSAGLERGEGDGVDKKFTHVLLVDYPTDIRDDWDNETVGNNADTVYVPDKNGVSFRVIFVEFWMPGTPLRHKRVYLARKLPTWPTNQL